MLAWMVLIDLMSEMRVVQLGSFGQGTCNMLKTIRGAQLCTFVVIEKPRFTMKLRLASDGGVRLENEATRLWCRKS